ncbi:hypothetical protein O7599_15965 [Streptomyces sp. WMMC500]|uniref:hypothetical protein n=1 Tax=Streptomyces sp. WMMC500 TaxID=3015154 RepID=UPI00248B2686|nr:hypothetical protein [Streptomyces sp. WMMC500]WBB63919.1 hypothetical protein O7599_15965 [Streptomyces sp. WMMC500]
MQQPGAVAIVDDLVAAFPHQLANDVRAVSAVMPAARIAPVSPFSVYVGDQAVAIPYRIYQDEPPVDVVRALTGVQQAILHCLYSRHSDGRVRQRHLERIASSDEPWAVPFVVQLAGEYVLEILECIQHGLSDLLSKRPAQRLAYGDFIAQNPWFFARTERRVVSYWSCYYRWRFPVFGTYPGCHLLDLLRAAAVDRTGRPWPRHTPPDYRR